jgi:hypothetical protein
MERTEYVLAVMAASNAAAHTPVQVQKLFFLLDENISAYFGGRQFNFEAFDYGPFDHHVYQELERLERCGDLEIGRTWNDRLSTYRTTLSGQQKGLRILESVPAPARDYIRDVSEWVRSQGFAGLVTAIYDSYPEMRKNSVFRAY